MSPGDLIIARHTKFSPTTWVNIDDNEKVGDLDGMALIVGVLDDFFIVLAPCGLGYVFKNSLLCGTSDSTQS